MHSLWPAIRASSYEASRNPIRVLEGTKHLHLLRGRIPFGEKISDRESNSWMYFFRLCPRLSNWKCRCSNGNAVLKMHAAEKFNSLEKKEGKEKERRGVGRRVAGGECLLGLWREGKTGIDLNLVWSLCQMISPSLPPRSTGGEALLQLFTVPQPHLCGCRKGGNRGARLHTGHKNSQDGARGRENWSGKLLVSGHGRLQDLLSSFLYSFSFL